MLKFLIFALLVAAILYAFSLRGGPWRPPRDDGPGPDPDPGKPPGMRRQLPSDAPPAEGPGEAKEMATDDSGKRDS